jgi:hypothetical protein
MGQNTSKVIVPKHAFLIPNVSNMRKIQDLDLIVYLPDDPEGSALDSALWHDDENICELSDDNHQQCVVEFGFFFGTTDSREPKFCPAHFFTGLGYKIKPSK